MSSATLWREIATRRGSARRQLMAPKNGHTWVLGSAVQADTYRSKDVPAMNYTYVVPAVFAQDEYPLGRQMTLSASARLDIHNKYGVLFNPRLSALFRLPAKFTARLSAGTGVFAPPP